MSQPGSLFCSGERQGKLIKTQDRSPQITSSPPSARRDPSSALPCHITSAGPLCLCSPQDRTDPPQPSPGRPSPSIPPSNGRLLLTSSDSAQMVSLTIQPHPREEAPSPQTNTPKKGQDTKGEAAKARFWGQPPGPPSTPVAGV